MSSSSHDDVREELAGVAASLRAYLEWQQDTGAMGIPRRPRGVGAPAAPASPGGGARSSAASPMAPTSAQEARPQPQPMRSAPDERALERMPDSNDGYDEPPPDASGAWDGDDDAWRASVEATAGGAEPPMPDAAVQPAPAPKQVQAQAPAPRAPNPPFEFEVAEPPPPATKRVATGTTGATPARVAVSNAPPRALEIIAEEVRGCTKCALAPTRTNTVFSRGNPAAKLCFIGEAPGADEDAQGIPFVGRAGQLLDKMIQAMGLDPQKDVYVCNIIKCRPPANRRPEPEETDACIPYLHEQIAAVDPKVIVALGNTAVGTLLNTKLGITKVRGSWKLYRGRIPVMPTYHPSYLLRPSAQQAEAKKQAWDDLQAVMKELGIAPKKA